MTNNLFTRTPALQTFVDGLSAAMGCTQTNSQALASTTCLACGQPATTFKDALSRREYGISGLCQACQDGVFEQDVPEKQLIDGVEVINICTLLKELLGSEWLHTDYDAQVVVLDAWHLAHPEAGHYGKPRESFNVYEAAAQAKAAGQTMVVVEDLS